MQTVRSLPKDMSGEFADGFPTPGKVLGCLDNRRRLACRMRIGRPCNEVGQICRGKQRRRHRRNGLRWNDDPSRRFCGVAFRDRPFQGIEIRPKHRLEQHLCEGPGSFEFRQMGSLFGNPVPSRRIEVFLGKGFRPSGHRRHSLSWRFSRAVFQRGTQIPFQDSRHHGHRECPVPRKRR